MMLNFYSLLSLLILSFFGDASALNQEGPTQTKSLYSYSLESLDTFAKVSLSDLQGKKSLWILFQPECKSCEAQLKDLSCLQANVKKIALGFWGHREELNKVVRFAKLVDQKLIVSTELEKAIGLKLTPTLLLVDQKGFVKETIYAKTACKILNEKLENI